MKTQTTVLIGIIIFAIIISFFGYKYFNQKETSTITVDGKYESSYKPDQAKVWAGISILKPNAQDAQNEANKVTNAIIDSLRAKGIKEEDIGTENFNLYEDKTWTQTGEKSNGWRATQTLIIKTRDFSKIGTIVDSAVNNGANQINNIEFSLTSEKEAEYKKKAISEATKSAKEKAEAMALGSGAKLGKVKSITESNFNYYPYMYNMAKTAGAGAVAESAQVLPKDVNVNANVMIVYEIK